MTTRTGRRGPSGTTVASIIGLAIIGGAMLAPGTPRVAKSGAHYLDTHPGLTTPLLCGLVVFIGIAVAFQGRRGFTGSATVGALVGFVIVAVMYAPLQHSIRNLPGFGFGDDKPTCKAGQVLAEDGHCVAKKGTHR